MKIRYFISIALLYAGTLHAQQIYKSNKYASIAYDYDVKYEMPGVSMAAGYRLCEDIKVELSASHRILDSMGARGKFNTLKPMLIFDYGEKISLLVGIGGLIGTQRTEITDAQGLWTDKNLTYFGYTARAGAEYFPLPKWALFGEYDYEYCVNSIFERFIDTNFRMKHILSVGLKYYF
ncbi:MAG: porin family protein [Dysgonamonadaceae bacterium]|jgi:opacity protein-like surface antigen|nr:porin family protein [Dysgonamonadaceae bacterium]